MSDEQSKSKLVSPPSDALANLDDDLRHIVDADLVEMDMGPPSPCPNVRGLNDNDAAEAMVEWFWENFEDPAEPTPHDEGEYVYIWGGPYYAHEELTVFIGAASERAVKIATDSIELEGLEWAPSRACFVPETELSARENSGN
jgi:hypothetical protein